MLMFHISGSCNTPWCTGGRVRPGNRLEALKDRRKGQWSIQINDQWRICFKWLEGLEGSFGPIELEVVNYH